MADEEQFCLHWNSHQTTLASIFDSLLKRNQFLDCTLAAEGQFLKAHKIILSACSPYFENLLINCHDKHPIFILKDVKFKELETILEFMYTGEIQISQDQLGSLLKVAESLQIKGFSDNRQQLNKTNDEEKITSYQEKILHTPLYPVRELNSNQENKESNKKNMQPSERRLQRSSNDINNVDDVESQYYDEATNVVIQRNASQHEFRSNNNAFSSDTQTAQSYTTQDLMLEPKIEFEDQNMSENIVEDLTLDGDDDDYDDTSMDYENPELSFSYPSGSYYQQLNSSTRTSTVIQSSARHQGVQASMSKRTGKFDSDQLSILESYFVLSIFQTPEQMKAIASTTGLSYKQVSRWFAGRRRKQRDYEKYMSENSVSKHKRR